MMSAEHVRLIRHNQCPVCGNHGFLPGPRGGAGQNIYCCNPDCRATFMVAPRNDIQLVERLSDPAPAHYYPPQVHIITPNGIPLCNFAGSITIDNGPPPRIVATGPDAWPIGHDHVDTRQFERSTCPACRERARS